MSILRIVKLSFCILIVCITSLCAAYCQNEQPIPSIWVQSISNGDSTVNLVSISNQGDSIVLDSAISGIMNYNPCLSYLRGGSPITLPCKFASDAELNVFIVYEPETGNTPHSLWTITLDSATSAKLTTQTLHKRSGRNIKLSDTTPPCAVISHFSDRWKGIETPQNPNVELLGDDSTSFLGQFSEFLLYDKPLSAEDFCKIYSRLVMKYSIIVDGIDLVNSSGDTIWRHEANSPYVNDISVLCHDNGYGLDQKQSAAQCGNAELTMFVGTLEKNNLINQVNITDRNYLIMTGNGNELSLSTDTILLCESCTPYTIFSKSWKANVIGNDFRTLPINLMLKLEEFSEASAPNLIVIRSEDTNSEPRSTDIYLPDSLDTTGCFYYNNIMVDTDGNGYDIFLFGIETNDSITYKSVYELSDNNEQNSDNSTTEEKKTNMKNNTYKDQQSCSGKHDVQINAMDIYPNPCHGEYTVFVSLSDKEEIYVNKIDDSGRTISTHKYIDKDKYEIKSFAKTPGTYIIEVRVGNNIESKQLVTY